MLIVVGFFRASVVYASVPRAHVQARSPTSSSKMRSLNDVTKPVKVMFLGDICKADVVGGAAKGLKCYSMVI